MAALSYALTTVAKVKLFLGISDATQDSLIEMLVNQTTDFIEQYCGGKRFLRTTYTNEIYDSKPGYRVFLKQYPVISLTTVEYRGGTVSTPVWNTYNADSYLLYDVEGYVYFYANLPDIHKGLRFTYVAGYLIDFANETDATKHTLPFDLTDLCTEIAATLYTKRQSMGVDSMQTEGQSITFAGSRSGTSVFNDIQKAVLNRYRKFTLTG